MSERKTRTASRPRHAPKSKVVAGKYKIVSTDTTGKRVEQEVEPIEIAYDVIGIRQEGKYVILDHIRSGLKIARFKNHSRAIDAIVALMQITNFEWDTPPVEIKSAVKEVLDWLAA